jgi:hypothetical protein
MYPFDISDNVTPYKQEELNWCGPANAQMCRNGYPISGERLYFTQQSLWDQMSFYNSNDPNDLNRWNSDPLGVKGCLQNLANPSGINWEVFADPNPDVVLISMLSGMNYARFPSPVLINEGEHWVCVVGWETDNAPVAGSNPKLQSIDYFDSLHDVGDAYTHQSANAFLGDEGTPGPWTYPVTYPGTWENGFVAIVQTSFVQVAQLTGQAIIPMPLSQQEKLLDREDALEAAQRLIEALGKRRRFGILTRNDVTPYDPMLVYNRAGAPQYYIVPFGIAGEHDDRGALVRVVMLINPFTGAFDEATAFSKPIRYLTREEAINAVAAAMRTGHSKLGHDPATLMFQPGEISQTRSQPFWRIEVGERALYVDQRGRVYGNLLRGRAGN